MNPGDPFQFEASDGNLVRGTVKTKIFNGTSRYIPDGGDRPWRELLIVETTKGNYCVRDRVRSKGAKGTLSTREWQTFGDVAACESWLRKRYEAIFSGDDDAARLFRRALDAIAKFSAGAIEI